MKKFILILLLCISSICFSYDEVKNQTYVIENFTNGLNTKTSPFSLQKHQSTVSENVRYSSVLGAISKRENINNYGEADPTKKITGLFRFYKKDGTKVLIANYGNKIVKGDDNTGTFSEILTVTSGDQRWDWVSWHDIAIGTDGYNQPIKYDGSSNSATYLGSCLAVDAGSGAGPDGTYSYKITFYTASYEISYDTPSNEITVTDNDIDLSMIPIAPSRYLGEDVIGRKVYRTTNGGSTYKLLSNGTITDNSTVTLTDSDADAALGADLSPTTTVKPPKGKFALIHKNRLFLANTPVTAPSRLYYSDDGLHEHFEPDSYFDIRQDDGDSITFVENNLGLLTVGKNNSIQKLYTDGDPVTDWAISEPFSRIGCQSPYSVSVSKDGIIYVDFSGIYIFNGQYSTLVSDAVTTIINDISPSDFGDICGIYYDNKYYLAYQSSTSNVNYNNRVLILEYLSKSFTIDLLNFNSFTAFNSGNDWGILYAGSSTDGNVYSLSEQANEIVHRKQSDFSGLWDEMRYVSTTAGGTVNSAELEISRTETIDNMGRRAMDYGATSETIDALDGIINRMFDEGHYVSQSMPITASSFDKLYWTESIPLSGGDVTFQLRTSTTGEQNLLINDDFEWWEHKSSLEPNEWVFEDGGTGSLCESYETVKRGSYSVKLTKGTTYETCIYQRLNNPSNFLNKNVVFTGWVKSDNTVDSQVYLKIDDGVSYETVAYSNTSGWEELSVYKLIDSSSTYVTVKCVVNQDANSHAVFDKVMAIEGTSAVNDWSAFGTAYTDPSGSDISAETVDNYLQYCINMTTDDITETPVISDTVVHITYEREGTESTESIPLTWQSGWLDLGYPSTEKTLEKFIIYTSGTDGTLSVQFENLEGDTDTFSIDLGTYPYSYKEYFTNGKFLGRYFRVNITNNDIYPLTIYRIVLVYSVQPEY